MRFALDVTPLLVEPRGGVARALAHLLDGLVACGGDADVVLVGPAPFSSGGPLGKGWRDGVPASGPVEKPATFRRRHAAALVEACGAGAWLSPFSAFPRVPVPVVATVHEIPFARLGPVEGRGRAWNHRRWLRRDARECAAIVVPSRATRDDLVALEPGAAARVRVVPHGFDPAPWAAAARGAVRRERHGVVVGATHARKGIGVLLDALPLVEDLGLSWTFVGRPRAPFARRLSAVARATALDALPDADLAREVASASFLAFPSLSEGFGYPPLEAMAAGVPVVAARAGAVPEVVSDAALLVEPGDAAALAAGIRRLATAAALSAALVERGRARVLAFPPAAAARAVLEALARAVAEAA